MIDIKKDSEYWANMASLLAHAHNEWLATTGRYASIHVQRNSQNVMMAEALEAVHEAATGNETMLNVLLSRALPENSEPSPSPEVPQDPSPS